MAEQHLIRWSPFDGMGRVSKDGHHIATFVTFADATRAVRGRAGCRSCKDPVRQRAEANQGGRDPSAAARPSTAKGSCKEKASDAGFGGGYALGRETPSRSAEGRPAISATGFRARCSTCAGLRPGTVRQALGAGLVGLRRGVVLAAQR